MRPCSLQCLPAPAAPGNAMTLSCHCSDKREQLFSKVVHSENHRTLQPQGSAGVSGPQRPPCLLTLPKRVLSCRMQRLASDTESLRCHGVFINSLLANPECL